MIEEYAVVEKIRDDSVDLKIRIPEHCDQCSIRENCYSRGNRLTVPIEESMNGISENDTVKVAIANTSVLGLTALIYGVPLIGFLVGVLGAYYGLPANFSDALRSLIAVGSGGILLVICGLLVRTAEKHISSRVRYSARLQNP